MAGVGRFYVWEIHHFSEYSHRGSQVFITQVFVLVFLHSRCPLQGKHIRDHGDEFAVGGHILLGADPAAEGGVQAFDAPAVPGHLDGMADGPLHLRGCGVEMLADTGIRIFSLSLLASPAELVYLYGFIVTYVYRGFGLQNAKAMNSFLKAIETAGRGANTVKLAPTGISQLVHPTIETVLRSLPASYTRQSRAIHDNRWGIILAPAYMLLFLHLLQHSSLKTSSLITNAHVDCTIVFFAVFDTLASFSIQESISGFMPAIFTAYLLPTYFLPFSMSAPTKKFQSANPWKQKNSSAESSTGM